MWGPEGVFGFPRASPSQAPKINDECPCCPPPSIVWGRVFTNAGCASTTHATRTWHRTQTCLHWLPTTGATCSCITTRHSLSLATTPQVCFAIADEVSIFGCTERVCCEQRKLRHPAPLLRQLRTEAPPPSPTASVDQIDLPSKPRF